VRKPKPHSARVEFSTGFQPGCFPEAPSYRYSQPAYEPASAFLRKVAAFCLAMADACEKNEQRGEPQARQTVEETP